MLQPRELQPPCFTFNADERGVLLGSHGYISYADDQDPVTYFNRRKGFVFEVTMSVPRDIGEDGK